MTMAGQAGELEGWLARKSAAVDYMVAIREHLGAGSEIADMREMQGLIAEGKEFLDFYYGHEDDGKVVFFCGGDVTDKMDPRSRIWYKEAKAQGKMIVTEVYPGRRNAVGGEQVPCVKRGISVYRREGTRLLEH